MSVETMKCPNCGGDLIFDPSKQDFKCEYCLSRFTQAVLDTMKSKPKSENADEAQKEAPQREANDPTMFTCPSCGAQVVTDLTTAADFCFYCHSHVTVSGRLEGEYLPDKILPFEISKDEAIKKFEEFVRKKKFVVKDFFSKKQIEALTGIYYPFWQTDCECDVDMRGSSRKLRVWRVGDIEYTETSTYDLIRKGKIAFDDITIKALKSSNTELMEGVQPFGIATKKFDTKFLAGFQAQMRDIEKDEMSQSIPAILDNECRNQLFASCHNGTIVGEPTINRTVTKTNSDYVLLPVWVMTYYYGSSKNKYYFSINGQNGKVCGNLPVDTGKLALFSGAIAAAVAAVMMILGYFA